MFWKPGKYFQLYKSFGFFAPYANLSIINTTWNFFSPDPAHTLLVKLIITDTREAGEDPVREKYMTQFFNPISASTSAPEAIWELKLNPLFKM